MINSDMMSSTAMSAMPRSSRRPPGSQTCPRRLVMQVAEFVAAKCVPLLHIALTSPTGPLF